MNLKAISLESQAKLHRLYAKNGIVARVFQSGEEKADILHELGTCGEPSVLIEILSWLLHSDRGVRSAAREAVHSLLSHVPLSRLPELDQRVREVGPQRAFRDHAWLRMAPSQVCSLGDDTHGLSIYGVTSFHPNGHVREAAIRLLDQYTTGAELPFLLLRLNDWVEPLRRLVAGMVERRLTGASARHFISNLQLVVRLELCGRADHTELLREIGAFLRSTPCRTALSNGTRSNDRGIRRMCFRIAGELEASEKQSILVAGLADPDPIVRLWTARRLLRTSEGVEWQHAAADLIRDSFAPIRALALQSAAERGRAGADGFLAAALLDRNAAVRETARYYLRKHGDHDFGAFYRAKLCGNIGSSLAAAINGLGETGVTADAEFIRPFVSGENPVMVRKATVTALGRLAPQTEREVFYAALVDNRPGVSRLASRALAKRDCRSDVARIRDLATRDHRPWVRKNALLLVCRLEKWDRLPILLACLTDPEAAVAEAAITEVRRWWMNYNRTFVEPSARQLDDTAAELRKHSGRLSLALHAELRCLVEEKIRQ